MADYATYAQPRRRTGKEHDRQSSRPPNPKGHLGVSTSGVEAKVVVMGNAGVGKTSLVQRYTTNSFNSTKTAATAGAAFHVKKTVVNGATVRLQLWDTAGQERFRSLAPMYYRGTHAAVLVYDITNPSSFDDIKVWLEELKKNVPPETEQNMIIYIVGTKVDLAHNSRKVRPDRARLKLAQWFPPPRAPTPPTITPKTLGSSMMMQYATSALSSTDQPSGFSIPSQLTSLSTSMSGHLPTLPSFNLNIGQLDRIRPRFTSFTSSTHLSKPTVHFENIGASPTGTETTTATGVSTSTGATSTSTAASSDAVAQTPPVLAPSSGSRFAFPRSTTTSAIPSVTGLNVDNKGSDLSSSIGFPTTELSQPSSSMTNHRPKTTSLSGAVEFPRAPQLIRRQTSAAVYGPNPSPLSTGIQTGKSAGASLVLGGRRPRTLSRLSDDERERDREARHRPPQVTYRRYDDINPIPSGSRIRYGPPAVDDSSSGDDLRKRPGSGFKKSRSRRNLQRSLDEKRRLEERGCLSDPEAGPGLEDDSESEVEEPQPWGLSQELKLCEVSAKDGQGVEELFRDLLEMVIIRRDAIEKDRAARERDSVMLSVPTRVPTWGPLGEEDEDEEADRTKSWGSWFGSICGI